MFQMHSYTDFFGSSWDRIANTESYSYNSAKNWCKGDHLSLSLIFYLSFSTILFFKSILVVEGVLLHLILEYDSSVLDFFFFLIFIR